jgi:hypothetical protein
MTTTQLSEKRRDAVARLMLQGRDGNFVIVHQDSCKGRVDRQVDCDCVPDVWRVSRGQA